MAQTVLITLTTAGADTGPFNLYSDVDGYVTPFETGVSKTALVAGYVSTLVPDAATIIRVKSNSATCINYIDLSIVTTTTTSSTSSTTTTSTSSTSSTSTTTTVVIGTFQLDPQYGINITSVTSSTGTMPSFTYPRNSGSGQILPLVTGFSASTMFTIGLSGTRQFGTNKTVTIYVNSIPQTCAVISVDGVQTKFLTIPSLISITDIVRISIDNSTVC